MAVEFVNIDIAVAIKFRNFEGRVRAKQVLKRLIERVEKRKNLSRQDVL